MTKQSIEFLLQNAFRLSYAEQGEFALIISVKLKEDKELSLRDIKVTFSRYVAVALN